MNDLFLFRKTFKLVLFVFSSSEILVSELRVISKRSFLSLTTYWPSMDDNTKKRPADGLELSKRCSGLSFRERKHDDINFHECKRTESSTGHNLTKRTQNLSSEKLKYMKPPLRFKSSNPNATSSSSSFSPSIDLNMSRRQNGESPEEANMAECSSNRQADNEDRLKFGLEFRGRRKEIQYSQSYKPPILHSVPSSSSSNSKAAFASRYGKQIANSIPQCAIGRAQRYGLKNLGCSSISNALPSGSFSDRHDKRAASLRKRFQNGEGSSSVMPALEGQQVPDDDTSRTKSQSNSRDTIVSLRTCPSSGGESSKMRSNEQEDGHVFELPEPILFPTRPHAPLMISEAVQERSPLPFDFQNTSFAGRPRSHGRSSRSRPVSNFEDVDDYLRLNMEGIAEVLQALERIEQDERLTYEQLTVLEANLLEGFSFHDQHRDMRLDIDNMSYEDLLALGEEIGSVSTALPEDALSKCLRLSTYRKNFLHMPGSSGHGDDDFKCSICQEEYMIGEELGRLPCKHHYHVTCIRQWLRLKNWCPICKAPALAQIDQT